MMISLQNRQFRSIIQAHVVFILMLMTGNFDLIFKRWTCCFRYSKSIIQFFNNNALPLRFGIHSVIRDDLIQNQTIEMVKKWLNLNEKLFLICDGTYARHQKSSNNEYILEEILLWAEEGSSLWTFHYLHNWGLCYWHPWTILC